MPTDTEIEVLEEALPETHEAPEIDVVGDEAIVRVNRADKVEERRVRLPKTTWG
jgi:hypothetical protein